MSDAAEERASRAIRLFRAGIEAGDPFAAVSRNASLIEESLRDGGLERLTIVAAGKAAAGMARAALDARGPRLADGLVVVHDASSIPRGALDPLTVIEAGHPLPDGRSALAAARIAELLDRAHARTLVLALLSGGASSLIGAEATGLDAGDLAATTDLLQRAGTPIDALNAVRKHLALFGGGRLAARAFPSPTLALVISDVPGDRIDVIASGPASPDPSTWHDALQVVESRGLLDALPAGARRALLAGAAGRSEETPKEGDPRLARARALIVLRPRDVAEAIAAQAEALGLEVQLAGEILAGEARACGREFAERALSSRREGRAVIAWGETTVVVRGGGRGGRNLEFALGAAEVLDGTRGLTLLAGATDGIDGSSDAAGAVVDGATIERARARGLDAARALADNDTRTFFERAGGLVMTGSTGTNVMDVAILLED